MNSRNDNATRPEVQDEITILGAASVETMGGGEAGETLGENFGGRISEE